MSGFKNNPVVKVLIPARNEVLAIETVLEGIPDFVSEIVVADNGSTDGTAKIARSAGAVTVSVPEPGYGRACMAAVETAGDCDVIVFMDGDASDHPDDMEALLEPILSGDADLVIGSRVMGDREKGSLTLQQFFGNSLACWLIARIWGHQYTDLGPFRAVRRDVYDRMKMQAPTFGWTVEMQIRALKTGLRCEEVPVRYRQRIGVSKISGTVRGVVLAGYYILGTIAVEAALSSLSFFSPSYSRGLKTSAAPPDLTEGSPQQSR